MTTLISPLVEGAMVVMHYALLNGLPLSSPLHGGLMELIVYRTDMTLFLLPGQLTGSEEDITFLASSTGIFCTCCKCSQKKIRQPPHQRTAKLE